MYERYPVDVTGIVLGGISIIILGAGIFVGLSEQMWVKALEAVLIIWLTFSVFSHFYAYTYAENFLSPFPTSPKNASENVVFGDYDLIPFKNLTFTAGPGCPAGAAAELNSNPGALWHHSTGVHGQTMKALLIAAVVFYMLPLIMFAKFDGAGADTAQMSEHVFAFTVLLVAGGLLLNMNINYMQDDRCGNEGQYETVGLGATPGSQTQSKFNQQLGTAVNSILVGVAGLGLLIEFLHGKLQAQGNAAQGENVVMQARDLFTRSIHVILFILLALDSIFVGSLIAENATDLCDPLYDSGGATTLTVIFLVTMVFYVVASVIDLIGPTINYMTPASMQNKMGMTQMQKKRQPNMMSKQNQLESTFI